MANIDYTYNTASKTSGFRVHRSQGLRVQNAKEQAPIRLSSSNTPTWRLLYKKSLIITNCLLQGPDGICYITHTPNKKSNYLTILAHILQSSSEKGGEEGQKKWAGTDTELTHSH